MSRLKSPAPVEPSPLKLSTHSREVQLHFLFLGLTFVIGLIFSWRCWPDPLIDFGHELYIPWRMNLGEVPYEDMMLVTGPASQLYHAALFKSFGTSLSVLITSNILWLILLAVVLYDSLALLSRRWVAFIAVLFFIIVFAFGQYTAIGNYNYVSPYRHEVTHGLIAGVLGLWTIHRAEITSRLRWYFLTGLLCGTTIAMKTEVAIPFIGALSWWGAVSIRQMSLRDMVHRTTLFLVGLIFPLVFCWLELQVHGLSPGEALRGVFASWIYTFRPDLTRDAKFYAYVGGWNEQALTQNIVDIITTSSIVFIFLALLAWFDRWSAGSIKSVRSRRAICLLFGILAFGLGSYMRIWNFLIPTLPAILLLLIVIATIQVFRSRRLPSPIYFEFWHTWGLWATFAFLFTLKMFFALHIHHYGFALAMPATLLGILLLLHLLPESLRLYTPPPRKHDADETTPPYSYGKLWQIVTVSILVGGMMGHFATSSRVWFTKNVSIGAGGDMFWGESIRDRRIIAVRRAYDFLKREMGTRDTLAVIPDGTMLNYLLRKKNPTPYLLLGPWDMRAAGGDAVVTAEFEKNPPLWIIVTSDDPGIHGTGQFGAADYGEKLADWIRGHYLNAFIVREASETSGGYSISILKRRPGPSPIPIPSPPR